MSVIHNSKSISVLKKHLKTKSSPKSLKTYINELEIDNDVTPENFNYETEVSSPCKDDPTNLNNIVNALKVSSKGSLPYPQNVQAEDSSAEICDFKNIGNLNNISFIADNSFAETYEEEDCEAENVEGNPDISQCDINVRLSEERTSDGEDEDDEDVNIIKRFKQKLLMAQYQLEQERINERQRRSLQTKDAYLEKLLNIRNKVIENLNASRAEAQLTFERERDRNIQLNEKNILEVDLIVKKYMDETNERKKEILKEVEAVNQEAEARELQRKKLLESVREQIEIFRVSLSTSKTMAENLPEEADLKKILFKELPSILDATEQTYEKMNPVHTTENDITVVSRRVCDAIKVLQDINNLLVERCKNENKIKEEKLKEAALDTSIVPEQTLQSSQPVRSAEEPFVTSNPVNNQIENRVCDVVTENKTLPQNLVSKPQGFFEETEKKFFELKEKFYRVSEEAKIARENTQLRPLLARAVGIVNTLNNEKFDSSNRGKLQQIYNLINGRPCTVGSDTMSTANNPSAQAFVKEQFAIRIVALSHDKQVSSMGIYASLIVRLWMLYPDVGELILFKLFETCPFLVPLSIKRDSGQTDEEFNRSIGIRHKEGGTQEPVDKYLTRMGAAAQLYGRIVSMDVENHPHGIEEGWKWMARTMNTPPQPNVTGTLLNGFLSVAGAPLLKHYGRQFRKLLHYLFSAYLPRIEEDILEGGHSVIAGLRSLLEEYQRTNSLPTVPDGYKLLL